LRNEINKSQAEEFTGKPLIDKISQQLSAELSNTHNIF
jgi:hypothetical protein